MAMGLRLETVTPDPSPSSRPPRVDLERELDRHRRELTGYCYRMLGSGSEAEDAVQETFIRAWKAYDRFEGRSSLRSWLYRIATNVCVDMHRGPQRRARPMDLGPSSTMATAQLRVQAENTFVLPVADGRVLDTEGDPAELAAGRESIRLAFVAALQHLPARQRAVLILCEVLKWQATEVAELLDTSVPSVNSALQRARATLGSLDVDQLDTTVDPEHEALLARYVDAFERYDMTALAQLLRDDVVISMPPDDLWLEGPDNVVGWMVGPGSAARALKPRAASSANGTGRLRQLPAVRPVDGSLGAVRDPGHRGQGRQDLRPPQLPVPRAVRRVRPAARSSRTDPSPPDGGSGEARPISDRAGRPGPTSSKSSRRSVTRLADAERPAPALRLELQRSRWSTNPRSQRAPRSTGPTTSSSSSWVSTITARGPSSARAMPLQTERPGGTQRPGSPFHMRMAGTPCSAPSTLSVAVSRMRRRPSTGSSSSHRAAKHAQEVPVGDQGDVAVHRHDPGDDGIGARRHPVDGLAPRDGPAPHGPAWLVDADLRGRAALEVAVVPLPQALVDLGVDLEPGQAARVPRSAQRAGQREGELPMRPAARPAPRPRLDRGR